MFLLVLIKLKAECLASKTYISKVKHWRLIPAVYKNAAASPNILPDANIIPVNISAIADGNITFLIVCHL